MKFNRKKLDTFHLKESQLKSYLEQNASILWVNGYQTDDPMFALITTEDLRRIKESWPVVPFIPWGGKPCFIVNESEFSWKLLERGRWKLTIDYRDVLARTEKELEDFESEIYRIAGEEGKTFSEELESLDILESNYYELLNKRLELLRRWVATDRTLGDYRIRSCHMLIKAGHEFAPLNC